MTQHHIIIIGESERLSEVMQHALVGDDYRVSGISSAFADARAVAALSPDLLIVDWLPGSEGHGLQTLQMLRLCKPLGDLPMIVCSAPISLVREIEAWLRGSSVKFLLKPFSLPELHRALHNALGREGSEADDGATSRATVAPAGERSPDERDSAPWGAGQSRILTPRRDEWEHPAEGDGPAETPLADETAAVGR